MIPAFLAPTRSTNSPSKIRKQAPARIGSATMNPFCSAERFSDSPICAPRGPSTVQTMKLKSKYKKAARSVGQWPEFLRSDSFISLVVVLDEPACPVKNVRPEKFGDAVAPDERRIFERAAGEHSLDHPLALFRGWLVRALAREDVEICLLLDAAMA